MTTQFRLSDSGLRCCSFKTHGFTNGLSMLQSLCSNHDIIILQEHWLHSFELLLFTDLFTEFNSYGMLSMNDKLVSGLLIGRPFGGVAIMLRKNLNLSMKIVEIDEGKISYYYVKS